MIKNLLLSAALLLPAAASCEPLGVFAYDNSILFTVPESYQLAPRQAFTTNMPVLFLEKKGAPAGDFLLILGVDADALKYEISTAAGLAKRKLADAQAAHKGDKTFNFSPKVLSKKLASWLEVFYYANGRTDGKDAYLLNFTYDGRQLSGACHTAEAGTCWEILNTMKSLVRGSSKFKARVKSKAPVNK